MLNKTTLLDIGNSISDYFEDFKYCDPSNVPNGYYLLQTHGFDESEEKVPEWISGTRFLNVKPSDEVVAAYKDKNPESDLLAFHLMSPNLGGKYLINVYGRTQTAPQWLCLIETLDFPNKIEDI